MRLRIPGYTILSILLLAFMAIGCPFYGGYKYNQGTFPANPVNLEAVNSEWDDFNASAPTLGEAFPLCFSSNRNSKGGDYDLVYKFISIEFYKTNGELRIFEGSEAWEEKMFRHINVMRAFDVTNSEFDELGPYLIPMEELSRPVSSESYQYLTPHILMFSSDIRGSQDIFFTHNLLEETYVEASGVDYLNSDASDAYPSFNSDRSRLYFCSDRESGFNIHYVESDPEIEITELLASGDNMPVMKETLLCSEGDDKCPFIAHHLMVFASNRSGGYGGFDLYYSEWIEGQWSDPVNFGPGINTEHNEYRPVIRPQWGSFDSDFMLFSSDRPGGLGGYDLYYVGIPQVQQFF